MNNQEPDDWELDTVKDYKSLVAVIQTGICMSCFSTLIIDLSKHNPNLFFTNYSLGYRRDSATGNMTKALLKKDKKAFDQLVKLVQPDVIICLGKMVSEMVIGRTIKGFSKKLKSDMVLSYDYPTDSENKKIKVYCVGHCGNRGVSNRGGIEKMKEDWKRISDDMRQNNLQYN